jgi:protein-L-isoaspartate(D-aspartate) O-methyltransferase
LAPLVGKLFSVERIEPLVKRAQERMLELAVRNVRFRHGDGMRGWSSQAPFDGILAAAAPLVVPEALLEQLAPGGRLVLPVGPEGQQQLLRVTRTETGVRQESLGPVSFVPLLAGIA